MTVIPQGGSLAELVEREGIAVPMPEANMKIVSAILHRDPATGSRSLAARFPAGFSRPVAGRYTSAEEFLVLSGELRIGDSLFGPGEWCFIPPQHPRPGFGSAEGALLYAWFSGESGFTPADDADGAGDGASGLSAVRLEAGNRTLREYGEEWGGSEVRAEGSEVEGPAELVDLTTWQWRRVESGERVVVGPGAAFVRTEPHG